jgi:hypothetical protein
MCLYMRTAAVAAAAAAAGCCLSWVLLVLVRKAAYNLHTCLCIHTAAAAGGHGCPPPALASGR